MISGLRVLAVIPARAGSRRCPGKNIRDFRGKPLIQWTLECARQSRYLDVIACSTDCPTTALIAWQQGAIVVPRPPELATDTAKSEDVMRHVLKLIPADIVVLLQPTSPLRIAEDIDRCVELYGREPVITVGEWGRRNGAVYVMRARELQLGHNFDEPITVWRGMPCYVRMPASRSLDIDFSEQFSNVRPEDVPGYVS